MDRTYFHSIYYREPGGVLFEIATNPPGFTVDEPAGTMGTSLKLPEQYEPLRTQIEKGPAQPQIHRRMRIHEGQPVLRDGAPLATPGPVLILLHGRGSRAEEMIELGRALRLPNVALVAPQAADGEWYPQRFLPAGTERTLAGFPLWPCWRD